MTSVIFISFASVHYKHCLTVGKILSPDQKGVLLHKSVKPLNKRSNQVRGNRIAHQFGKDCVQMYNILTLGFETAKRWNYIAEIPNTKGPSEHYKRRKAWSAEYISKILDQIQEDPILHLSLHLAFVCSLRAGEIVAIDIHSINLDDGSMWISQILERVSDEALKNLSREKIAKVFPKQFSNAKSRLVLKIPKTEGSLRKQYLTQAHWFKKSKSMLLEVRLKKRKTLKPLA